MIPVKVIAQQVTLFEKKRDIFFHLAYLRDYDKETWQHIIKMSLNTPQASLGGVTWPIISIAAWSIEPRNEKEATPGTSRFACNCTDEEFQ